MSRTVCCLAALAALAIGCTRAAPPAPAPTTASGGSASVASADDEAAGTSGGASVDPFAAANGAADTSRSEEGTEDDLDTPLAADDEPADDLTAADVDEEGEDADGADDLAGDAEEGGTELTADELIEKAQRAAQEGDNDKAIEHLRNAVKADPENRQARLFLAYFLQGHAIASLEDADGDDAEQAAYALLAEAGEHAQKLTEGDAELSDIEQRVVPDILYNSACGRAKSGKPDEALAMVKQALEAGFSDFARLETDEDLAAVREQAEFDSLVAEYRVKAQEAAQEHARELLAENEPFAFDFTLPGALDDKPVKLADFKGKVLIVDIWGTWCPPCRMEVPHFIALRDKYHEQGLEIVGINYEGSEGEEAKTAIKDYSEEVGINYPLVIGDQPTQDQVPNLEGYPTTLFLDRAGTVRLKVVGYHDYIALEGIVLTLLAEPAPETPAEDAATGEPAEEPAEDQADQPAEEETDAPAE